MINPARLFTGRLLLTCATLGVAGCASVLPSYNAGAPCVADAFTVTDQFQGARRGRCVVTGPGAVQIEIRPEDEFVTNQSPWYAFKISPSVPGDAVVALRYFGSDHRYWPKVSQDGIAWRRLDASEVISDADQSRVEFRIPLTDKPVWVSAQELITPPFYDVWNQKIETSGVAKQVNLGNSLRGLALTGLDTQADVSDILFIVGRQHPPEVSGAFAFFSFAETLFADTELAREFRSRFRIIAVPLVNPDGVVGGNWRHNLGSKDLNRDWGPFEQPETQAMKALLDKLDADGMKIRVFLDFHSTNRNLLYSQSAGTPTDPTGFTPEWLALTEAKLSADRIENYKKANDQFSDYQFTNEASPVSEQANSKNYIYNRYGIPSITFEVGDETDRSAIRSAAAIFAEQLMELMLTQSY